MTAPPLGGGSLPGRDGKDTEERAPLLALPEAVGTVHRMACLVAEQHHHFIIVLDDARLLFFEVSELGIRRGRKGCR